MFLKKKAITLSAVLLCICLLSLLSRPANKSKTASVTANNTTKIIIDAGHGGLTNTTH